MFTFPTTHFGGEPPASWQGRIMTGGQAGNIWFSDNAGASWTLRPLPYAPTDGRSYKIVTDNNGTWWVHMRNDVTSSQEFWTSDDAGATWTNITGNLPSSFCGTNSLSYANGRLWISASNNFYYSTNGGSSWTSTTLTPIAGGRISSGGTGEVVWTGSAYVCVVTFYSSGFTTYYVGVNRSTDGTNWSEISSARVDVTSSFSDGVCVTHDGSGNVVVGGEDGYVAYSTDHGATFTVSALGSSSTEDVFDVATDGSGTWVIVTHFGGEVHRSTDNGATWTRTEASFAYVAGGIIWDGSQFVASGSNGFNQTYFLTSTTGASSSWTANSTGLGIDLTSNNALAYDSVNGDYILFGYDNAGIYTITTTNISTYSNYLFESADSRNVVAITHDSNQDRWIILVSATLNNGGYYSDDDGATWTACTGDIVGSGTNYGIHYCDFLQDTFVGNGNDIARSTDGAAFSYVFTQAGAGGCYAFADNGVDMVVAVGDSSFDHIKSSNSTGGTWTDRNPDTNTDRLQSICYSATEGLWVAVGDDCGIQSSSNGTSWTLEEQNLNTFDGFYYVFYSDVLGQFIAHSATIGVYESSDGLTWAQNDSGANYTFSVSGSYQDAFSYSIYDPGGEDEKEILFATRNTTNPTLYVSSNLKTFNSEIQVAVASVDLYCVKAVADPPPA